MSKSANPRARLISLFHLAVPQQNLSLRNLKKMDDLVKQYDALYEDMAEAKAEGGTGGYSDKPSGSNFHA